MFASSRPATTQAGPDFDRAIEGFRQALDVYMKGDAAPVIEFFSRRDDVTIANPILPPRRGHADVVAAINAGAAPLSDGSVRSIEEIARYGTPDLGYVVQLERSQTRIAGSSDMRSVALRATMILRPEGDAWKIVHRHADPITTPRPITTVIAS
jgi:ketosteroid isomerase-like protein